MIEENMKKWHLHLKGQLPGGLDELIDEDCVFYSPVVFTAQKGKALTKMYLNAAGGTFNDDKGKAAKTARKMTPSRKQHWRICRNQSLDTVKKSCRVIRPCSNLSQR